MFISKLSLPRRTFLRGVGATVALPLLEAMVPALTATAKTAAAGRLRFGAVYIPHGAIMDRYTPASQGVGFEFSPILKPLESVKEHVVVVSNLDRPGNDDSHATASAAWLSGAVARKTEGQDFRLGTTVDQVIAKQIGQDSPFASIEVATEDFTGYVGGCSPGYACAYMNTIAWASPTQPVPMEINPRVVRAPRFSVPSACSSKRASSTPSKTISTTSNAISVLATSPSSAAISTTSGRSSAEFNAPRRRTRPTWSCLMRRSACRRNTPSMLASCSTFSRWPTRPTSLGCSRS
jgi:Protein of unknown function (DUF1552)